MCHRAGAAGLVRPGRRTDQPGRDQTSGHQTRSADRHDVPGPGRSGSQRNGFVRDGSDDIDKWGDGRFDLIGWDLRGTHASSPVKCFASDADAAAFWEGVAIPSTPEEAAAYITRMKDVVQRCAETMGPLLSHISTTDTVRDMDRIREFIGDETITYSGLSYGTFIGQIYANMHPYRCRYA